MPRTSSKISRFCTVSFIHWVVRRLQFCVERLRVVTVDSKTLSLRNESLQLIFLVPPNIAMIAMLNRLRKEVLLRGFFTVIHAPNAD